jgi:hypothetical protein
MKHMHNTSLWRSPWTFLQLLLALTTLSGGTLAAPQVLSGVDAYGYSNPLLTPPAPLTWKAIDLANDGYGAGIGLLTDDSLLRIEQSPVLDPQRARGIHYRAVSAGAGHFLALRSNGSILAFGNNQAGQCNVPALPPGLIYKSVVARGELSGALLLAGWCLDGADPASAARYLDAAKEMPESATFAGCALASALAHRCCEPGREAGREVGRVLCWYG